MQHKKWFARLKEFLLYMFIVYLILWLWIGVTYISKRYYQSTASAEQFLGWIVIALIVFLVYPMLSKQKLSRLITKKTQWKETILDIPQLSKSGWVYFILLHLFGIVCFGCFFYDGKWHDGLYTYLSTLFSSRYLGFIALFIGFLGWYLYKKISFKEVNISAITEKNKEEKQHIFFAFLTSTTITLMLIYAANKMLRFL